MTEFLALILKNFSEFCACFWFGENENALRHVNDFFSFTSKEIGSKNLLFIA